MLTNPEQRVQRRALWTTTMCVVQVVPFARSVPGGSRNDGRGVGERMGSRYMSQQTSMNKTSCAEHSQKYGRVATRTKGQEKKMTYWKKKKKNLFTSWLLSHTALKSVFLVSDALHQVKRGSSMAVCFRKKSAGSCFMLYSIIQIHAAAARLQHAQAPPAPMPTAHLKFNAARQQYV